MRYLVVGVLTMAGIVLGIIAALYWALHGAIALAWTAFSFGALGILVLIACLWLYARTGTRDARQEHAWPPEYAGPDFGPAGRPRDRAQERAWMRDPSTVAVPQARRR